MAMDRRASESLDRGDAWAAATGQVARWVGLDLDLHVPRTWFGPSWMMLGGMLSSGSVPLELRTLITLAVVAWLISEPLLGSLLALSVEIARVRRARLVEAASVEEWRVPYLQPASPGRRALDRLATRAARLAWNWRASQGACERWLLLALITLVLSAVAGGWVPGLVLLALVVLAYVAMARPLPGGVREGLASAQILVAWLVGRSAFADPDYLALMVGLGFAAAWYAWTRRPPLANVLATTQVLLAGLLALTEAPIAAGAVLLLAVPLFVLQPESPSNQRTYLAQTQIYLMASLVLAALSAVWAF